MYNRIIFVGIFMGFYDLSKRERQQLVAEMEKNLLYDLENSKNHYIHKYSGYKDTYIRRKVYLILGRLYRERANLREKIINASTNLYGDEDEKKRQTAVYIWTEIGKFHSARVLDLLTLALADNSPVVRNGFMGGLKRMGEKNPLPTLKFAEKHINDSNPEVRRIIIHGI